MQPCEDCISRTQALEMLGDEPENWTDTEKEIQEVNDYRWFKSILESLPSVTPQRPKGKWIDIGIAMEGRKHKNHECDMADAYCCDYCGYNQYIKTNYCPWCGAEMVGEEEK